MKLEVVVIPVSDVDRAKDFYTALGWRLDIDIATDEDFRVVHLTPPGSPTSVVFGTSVTSQVPGTAQGLHLVVDDIVAAHDELKRAGADPGDVFHDAGGVFHHAGTRARVPGPEPRRTSYGSFLSFNDPDGNEWVLQEITRRLPGRVDPAATTFSSADDLASALRRAAAARHRQGEGTGPEDPDWPEWFARYLVREQTGAAEEVR
ncbi:VOC family protein [Streptomyces sp. NPDC047841]|uniref:VOC family protein n=1 Tax=Streptomyces sp. NPDC047841 TaxID=3154708 RepID=UPI0034568E06